MRTLLALMLSCAACLGQFAAQQPFFQSAAVPAWSPSTLTNLMFWWVASDLASNSTVSAWTDRVASFKWNQGTLANRPLNTGTNGVYFDGNSRFLTPDTNFAFTTGAMFLIYQPHSVGSVLAPFVASGIIPHGGYGILVRGTAPPTMYEAAPAADVFKLNDNLTNDYHINMTPSLGSGDTTNGVFVSWSGKIWSGTVNWIGWDPDWFGSYYDGRLVEMMVFSSTNDFATITKLHNYATNTYGFSP